MNPMRRYLRDGAIAGMVAGAVSAVVLRLLGEGAIGRAVALEHAHHPGTAGEELFSRTVQQAGGVLAILLYGLALGAIFSVVFVAVRPKLGQAGTWLQSMALAGVGFAGIFAVPFLKYPANPPGVGDPATIGRRTALYLVLLGWSVVATWATWRAARWMRTRPDPLPDHLRMPAAALCWITLVAVGMVVLPPNSDAVPAPAQLIWTFRLASTGGAVALWSTIGVVFGWLRLAHEGRRPMAALNALRPGHHQDTGSRR